MTVQTVILDLDGTLVDSVYVHTLAWRAAFRDVDVAVPAHRIHRLIGMGGDRVVTEAAGQEVEDRLGDAVRERQQVRLGELIDHVTAADGAVELLEALGAQDLRVVLASSGDRDVTERLLGLLGDARSVLDAVITGSDAQRSKPDGELVTVALGEADPRTTVMLGDAVWDVHAARDAGVRCVGLLTGGFSTAELTDAGAVEVVSGARELAQRLVSTGRLLTEETDPTS